MSNMQASPDRALDAEVAEKVLGWIWGEPKYVREGDTRYRWLMPVHSLGNDYQRAPEETQKASNWRTLLPRVSSDIKLAMSLFETMVESTGCGGISLDMEDARGQGHVYLVRIGGLDGHEGVGEGPLPEAICRAALAATDQQQPGDAAAREGGE